MVLVAEIQCKIDILISSSLVSSCVLIILKQYLRSISSSSLRKSILSVLRSLGERVGFPLSGGELDG